MVEELPVTFSCEGETLLGIVSRPVHRGRVGVVIMVGGLQYRAGSHRQFVRLARYLAQAGYAVLRFDFRGMGDSTGGLRNFEEVNADVQAAIATLRQTCEDVEEVVLWGLCDGASAALLFLEQIRAPEVVGLCLLNPWVRSEATLARAHVKHYYAARLMQADFWRKLGRGAFDWRRSTGDLWRSVVRMLRPRPGAQSDHLTYQQRMAKALRDFRGKVLLVISSADLTGHEFLDCATTDPDWRGLLDRPKLRRVDIADADHTFSQSHWRQQMEQAVVAWLADWAKPT